MTTNDARLPLRLPAKTHRTLKYLAKALETSMNDIVVNAVDAEITRLKGDPEVMSQVKAIIEEERGVLEDLTDTPPKKARRKKPAS